MKKPNEYNIHLDIDKLEWWLNTSTDMVFEKYSDRSMHEAYRYIFRKTEGAKILAVAHLDTVQPLSGIVKREGAYIHASGLDDRLGAYIAWDWLQDNGVVADILLTDHEESGMSTAEFFGLADEYNWIVEFDREGQDVVTYGLDSDDWLSALFRSGFDIRQGAFSDICFLDTDTCCVNIGNGMHLSHSNRSFMNMKETQGNLQSFMFLYDQFQDVDFRQSPTYNKHATQLQRKGDDRSHLVGGGWAWDEETGRHVHDYNIKSEDSDVVERATLTGNEEGIWWKDEDNNYHLSKDAGDVKGQELLCIDCNAPAMPTEMGELCISCYQHYHRFYNGADVDDMDYGIPF
jgi:hypothetical protein